MPQENRPLIIHELSVENQQKVNDYMMNFHENSLSLSAESWDKILRKSKDIIEVFNTLLNEVNYKDALLFIEKFPKKALEEGYETSMIFATFIKYDKDNILLLKEISGEFECYYRKKIEKKEEYLLNDFLRDLFRKLNKKLIITDCENILNKILVKYHESFLGSKGYCQYSEPNIHDVDDLQVLKLKLNHGHEIETAMEEWKKVISEKKKK